jgi:hypothetical protein
MFSSYRISGSRLLLAEHIGQGVDAFVAAFVAGGRIRCPSVIPDAALTARLERAL